MEDRVEAATIYETLARLAPDARTLLVAVSGGGDSVALLRLLCGGPYRLEVAHVDHALRPDSADDAQFVRALSETLKMPHHGVRLEVARIAQEKGWNLEDAARRLRYDFLTRTAKRVGAGVVVTGHTQDDQGETVLMQLLRGAAHLGGIPARRGQVVRPLLGVSRQKLRGYLTELNQPFLDDPTNTDTRRTRAWLRHEVLPLLAQRYPAVSEKLARYAELQHDQADFLEVQATRFLREGSLELTRLHREPPALQRAAIATLLTRVGVPVDTDHIEKLRFHLDAVKPVQVSLPHGRHARIAYGRLEVAPAVTPAPPPTLPETLPTEVDPAKLAAFPELHFRTRAPGDRIRLAGGSKKVSDLLIDRKVPRERRDALRVLATAPVGPSEVLWIEGVATDVRVAGADPDVLWMQRALVQAEAAARAGEVPVGAVVVCDGELVAETFNTTRSDADPTAHAELKALREGGARTRGLAAGGLHTLMSRSSPAPCVSAQS